MVPGQLLVSQVPTKGDKYIINCRNNIVAVITRACDTYDKGNLGNLKRQI